MFMANNKEKHNKGIKGFFKRKAEKKTNADLNNIKEQPINAQVEEEKNLPRDMQLGEDSPAYSIWELWNGKEEIKYNPLEYVFEEFKDIYESNKDNSSTKTGFGIEEIKVLINDITIKSEELYHNILENEKRKIPAEQHDETIDGVIDDDIDSDLESYDLSAYGGISKIDDIVEFDMFKDDVDEHDNELYNTAKKVLAKSDEIDNKASKDAYIFIRVSPDNMHAWIFIYPPRSGGEEISVEMLKNALEDKKIIYGTDNNMMVRIAEKAIF